MLKNHPDHMNFILIKLRDMDVKMDDEVLIILFLVSLPLLMKN